MSEYDPSTDEDVWSNMNTVPLESVDHFCITLISQCNTFAVSITMSSQLEHMSDVPTINQCPPDMYNVVQR